MAFCDVHCHLLPRMDDGAKDEKISLAMLAEQFSQGGFNIAATPHYYPRETVDSFLARRKTASGRLAAALRESHWNKELTIVMGAEVAYHNGLVYEEKLSQLCIGKTNYLLLEMPFMKWETSVLRNLQMMRNTRGVFRSLPIWNVFLSMKTKRPCRRFWTWSFRSRSTRSIFWTAEPAKRRAGSWKAALWIILGSDSHNMEQRRPNLKAAYDQLEAWKMAETAYRLAQNSMKLLKC